MPGERPRQSALMTGPVAELLPAGEFPIENVLLARDKYSYEGNWLFCNFDRSDIRAARIGFGLGRFHWEDYGLEAQPTAFAPVSYRVEVITETGVHACIFSDPEKGTHVRSDLTLMKIEFSENHQVRFNLSGWPQMHWRFQSRDAFIQVHLLLELKNMAVWPDCIMPNNTFSMCIGVGVVSGSISLGGKEVKVTGGGVYDHPRVVVQPNAVPPFGWYLYSPLRFSDGSYIVSYYAEDGLGAKDDLYSTGFFSSPDRICRWVESAQIRRLTFGKDGLPASWEAQLEGQGVSITYRTRIANLSLVHSPSLPDSDRPSGKYLAFPLLMESEGKCRVDGKVKTLRGGSGIAEFLVRKGHHPVFP